MSTSKAHFDVLEEALIDTFRCEPTHNSFTSRWNRLIDQSANSEHKAIRTEGQSTVYAVRSHLLKEINPETGKKSTRDEVVKKLQATFTAYTTGTAADRAEEVMRRVEKAFKGLI